MLGKTGKRIGRDSRYVGWPLLILCWPISSQLKATGCPCDHVDANKQKMLLLVYFLTTIGDVLKASQPIFCRKLNRIFLMMSSRRSRLHVLRLTSEREQTKSGRQRK